MIPKLSILVPVYKASKWLLRFVLSLAAQNLGDLAEYVFVDDCSPDDSCDVLLRELAAHKLDSRSVILRHNVNRGVSEARQTLLEAANGEFIIYADPDDWMEPGMYRDLLDEALRTGSDFVWEDFYENGKRRRQELPGAHGEAMICAILDGKIHGATWNKLLKREFVLRSGARFLPGRVGLCEDVDFLCQILAKNPVLSYADGCHYQYVTVSDSATHGLSEKSFDALAMVGRHLDNVLDAKNERDALRRWKRGACFACFISEGISDEYFYRYAHDVKVLWGLKTNIGLKILYSLAAWGFRPFALRIYHWLKG